MAQLEIYTNRVANILDRCLKVTGAVVVLACLYLGFAYYRTSVKLKETNLNITARNANMRDAQHVIDHSKEVKVDISERGLKAVGQVQEFIEKSAENANCELSEFQAGSDILPYLSRFSRDTAQKGWGQIDATATLKGTLPQIVAMLQSFSGQKNPVELDSIELTRTVVDKSGTSTLTAKLSIRVLTKGEA